MKPDKKLSIAQWPAVSYLVKPLLERTLKLLLTKLEVHSLDPNETCPLIEVQQHISYIDPFITMHEFKDRGVQLPYIATGNE